MCFRSRAVVSGNAAGVGLRLCRIANDDAAVFVAFHFSRWHFLLLLFRLFSLRFRLLLWFGDNRLGFGGFRFAFLCDRRMRLCLCFFCFGRFFLTVSIVVSIGSITGFSTGLVLLGMFIPNRVITAMIMAKSFFILFSSVSCK